jgi:RNA polymerase sigma-70 factor (ECF subfamily)
MGALDMTQTDLPQTRLDEQELLQRIKAGDTSACAVCIESHSPSLYRMAMRVVRDEAEAEDVLQETFLSAFKAIQYFDGRSSLGTWLYRIAYNTALMKLRSRRESLSLDDDAGDAVPLQIASPDHSPDDVIVEHETAQMLGDAINTLPKTLREVFVLREMEEFSTLETAQKLSISEGAVKVRLHRARQALREQLGAYMSRDGAQHKPAQSLACTEALRFMEQMEQRGEKVDASLRDSLREYIASCEQCRLLLDPKHESVLFYCGEHKNPVPERVQRRLYKRIHQLWADQASAG